MNFFPMTTRKRFYFHFYSLCVLAILLIRSFAFLTKLMTMMMPIVLFVFTLLWWTWWGPWTWWWTWWVARCQWTLNWTQRLDKKRWMVVFVSGENKKLQCIKFCCSTICWDISVPLWQLMIFKPWVSVISRSELITNFAKPYCFLSI